MTLTSRATTCPPLLSIYIPLGRGAEPSLESMTPDCYSLALKALVPIRVRHVMEAAERFLQSLMLIWFLVAYGQVSQPVGLWILILMPPEKPLMSMSLKNWECPSKTLQPESSNLSNNIC